MQQEKQLPLDKLFPKHESETQIPKAARQFEKRRKKKTVQNQGREIENVDAKSNPVWKQ